MGLQTLRTALLLLTIIVFGSGLGTAQSQQTPPVTQGQQTPSGTAGLLLAKEGLSDYEKGNGDGVRLNQAARRIGGGNGLRSR